jgi:hypothetical protein
VADVGGVDLKGDADDADDVGENDGDVDISVDDDGSKSKPKPKLPRPKLIVLGAEELERERI